MIGRTPRLTAAIEQARLALNTLRDFALLANETPGPLTGKPFLYPLVDWPLRITSRFGEHRPAFDHEGVDFSAVKGRAVHACYEGLVEKSYVGKSYGLCVWINHLYQGRKIVTIYAHLSRSDVVAGQPVRQGQIIGASGGDPHDGALSGNSTGPHLHITVLDSSVPTIPRGCGASLKGAVDPLLWIELPK